MHSHWHDCGVNQSANRAEPLAALFDALLFDLDGVLYIGEEPVAHAAPALALVSSTLGVARAYITNNASRTPEQVVDVLAAVGVAAIVSEVVTSAQVAAAYLAEQLTPGSAVLVVGGEGLIQALLDNKLRPVRSLADDPQAVVQGFHPDVGWRDLARASAAVSQGLPWVASNADLTIPTAEGIAPGNGTLIAAVSTATGRTPVVVGKPNTPAVDSAIARCGAKRPIIVGDRLDTDIEAANRAGIESLLVMTGVTTVDLLIGAPAIHRPTHIAVDLRSLLEQYNAAQIDGDDITCGEWGFVIRADRVEVTRGGSDPNHGLRALALACWTASDRGIDVSRASGDAIASVNEAVAAVGESTN